MPVGAAIRTTALFIPAYMRFSVFRGYPPTTSVGTRRQSKGTTDSAAAAEPAADSNERTAADGEPPPESVLARAPAETVRANNEHPCAVQQAGPTGCAPAMCDGACPLCDGYVGPGPLGSPAATLT